MTWQQIADALLVLYVRLETPEPEWENCCWMCKAIGLLSKCQYFLMVGPISSAEDALDDAQDHFDNPPE